MSDVYGQGEEYTELLAYQLLKQFNTTHPATYDEVEFILQDMLCPPECEVWFVGSVGFSDLPRTLYWYCGPVLIRYRGKTWLITDKFYRSKDDIHYFSDAADIQVTSEFFKTAFPGAKALVKDWIPF